MADSGKARRAKAVEHEGSSEASGSMYGLCKTAFRVMVPT